jgi:hypothetical protein
MGPTYILADIHEESAKKVPYLCGENAIHGTHPLAPQGHLIIASITYGNLPTIHVKTLLRATRLCRSGVKEESHIIANSGSNYHCSDLCLFYGIATQTVG